MMVRPQRWNDLRDNSPDSEASPHHLMTCENCGRMLFYDPARVTRLAAKAASQVANRSRRKYVLASL